MKVLALEVEKQGAALSDFGPLLIEEAQKVWEFQQKDIIRKVYFNAVSHCAVIILEAKSQDQAKEILAQLPLVKEGLIAFNLIPLTPYDGYARLFQ